MTSPRVLLSIDYEPWISFFQDDLSGHSSDERRAMDGGYSESALPIILDLLGAHRASIFVVGELVSWCPRLPTLILDAGHELGFHCHSHHHIRDAHALRREIEQSQPWIDRYGVRGYRAPFVTISDEQYEVLGAFGFRYSSSIYAPTGLLRMHGDVCEVPVSTYRVLPPRDTSSRPRNLSPDLLLAGEIPYGSSFFIGLLGTAVLPLLRRELALGRSPVLVLHSYQLVQPAGWPSQVRGALRRNVLLRPFVRPQVEFLRRLLDEFPTGPIGAWLVETCTDRTC